MSRYRYRVMLKGAVFPRSISTTMPGALSLRDDAVAESTLPHIVPMSFGRATLLFFISQNSQPHHPTIWKDAPAVVGVGPRNGKCH